MVPRLLWAIGNGKEVRFWEDRWVDLDFSLREVAEQEIPENERMGIEADCASEWRLGLG